MRCSASVRPRSLRSAPVCFPVPLRGPKCSLRMVCCEANPEPPPRLNDEPREWLKPPPERLRLPPPPPTIRLPPPPPPPPPTECCCMPWPPLPPICCADATVTPATRVAAAVAASTVLIQVFLMRGLPLRTCLI